MVRNHVIFLTFSFFPWFLEIFMKRWSCQMSGFQNFFVHFLKNLFCWTYTYGLKSYHFFTVFEIFMKSWSCQILGFLKFFLNFSKKRKNKSYSNGQKPCHFFIFCQILRNIHEKWELPNIVLSEHFTSFFAEYDW